MTPAYGIDTSVFVRLLTGHPEKDFEETVAKLKDRLTAQPGTTIAVSNQVIGEAYIALQHHYKVSKLDARKAITSVLTSGLCAPLHGRTTLAAIATTAGCGLLDRLIVDDYAEQGLTTLTNDRRMSRLDRAERL